MADYTPVQDNGPSSIEDLIEIAKKKKQEGTPLPAPPVAEEGDTTPNPPETLADTVTNSIKGAASSNNPSSKAYDTAVAQLQGLYQQIPDRKDQGELRRLEQEARSLYREDANRNSWLSLADRIGQALTKIGGGILGNKLGVDMTKVDLGPGYDWQTANKEARQQYLDTLSSVDRQKEAADQAYKDQLTKHLYNIEGQKSLAGEEKYKYGLAQQAAREDARQKAMLDRYDLMNKTSQDRLDKKEQEAEKNRQAREELAIKKMGIQDLLQEEKITQDQLNAANTVLTQVKQVEDINSNKTKNDIDKKLGAIAGKAGIDLEAVKKIQEDTRGGIFSKADNSTRDNQFNVLLQPIKQKLDEIKRRKTELLGSGAPSQSPAPPPVQTDDRVLVVNPQGVQGRIPRSQLDSALQQGYKEVK